MQMHVEPSAAETCDITEPLQRIMSHHRQKSQAEVHSAKHITHLDDNVRREARGDQALPHAIQQYIGHEGHQGDIQVGSVKVESGRRPLAGKRFTL
jgi:hypothetical protein